MFERVSLPSVVVLLVSLCLASVGCGGGGGGGGGGAGAAPSTKVDFPPADAVTRAMTLTVSGTESQPGQISVNGVIAARNMDNSWSATIPLFPGEEDIIVSRDGVEVLRQQIDNRAPRMEATGIVVDPTNGDVYVSDGASDVIYRIDATTGETETIADSTDLSYPEDLALDTFRNRLYVNDGGFRVLVVDLDNSNNVSTVSSGSVGLGPIVTSMSGLEFQAGATAFADDTLIATEYATGRIYSINCASGFRSFPTSGSFFGIGNGVAAMEGLPTYLIATERFNNNEPALTSIRPTDGSPGGVLSNRFNGTGPMFVLPEDVVEDAANDLAYVSDVEAGVISVDTTTMNRVALAPIGEQDGVRLDQPMVIDLDPMSGSVIVGDGDFGSVVEIAPNGQRTELTASRRGSGPTIGRPGGAAFANGEILMCGPRGQVLAVNPVTGDRSLVSGADRGVGSELEDIRDLDVMNGGNTILALDRFTGVYRIDRATGDRVHVTPTVLSEARAIAYDPIRDIAVVAFVNEAIAVIDLATGDRTNVLSTPTGSPQVTELVYDSGTGNMFVFIGNGELRLLDVDAITFNLMSLGGTLAVRRATFDEEGERLIVSNSQAIFEIDLTTGFRTTLSDEMGIGGGFPLRTGQAITMDPSTGLIHVGIYTGVLTVNDAGDRVLISR